MSTHAAVSIDRVYSIAQPPISRRSTVAVEASNAGEYHLGHSRSRKSPFEMDSCNRRYMELLISIVSWLLYCLSELPHSIQSSVRCPSVIGYCGCCFRVGDLRRPLIESNLVYMTYLRRLLLDNVSIYMDGVNVTYVTITYLHVLITATGYT